MEGRRCKNREKLKNVVFLWQVAGARVGLGWVGVGGHNSSLVKKRLQQASRETDGRARRAATDAVETLFLPHPSFARGVTSPVLLGTVLMGLDGARGRGIAPGCVWDCGLFCGYCRVRRPTTLRVLFRCRLLPGG